jgi:hypothetical protein
LDAWFVDASNGLLYGNGQEGDESPPYQAFDESLLCLNGKRIGLLLDLDDGSLFFFKDGEKHGKGYGPGSVTGPVVHALSMWEVDQGGQLILDADWPGEGTTGGTAEIPADVAVGAVDVTPAGQQEDSTRTGDRPEGNVHPLRWGVSWPTSTAASLLSASAVVAIVVATTCMPMSDADINMFWVRCLLSCALIVLVVLAGDLAVGGR